MINPTVDAKDIASFAKGRGITRLVHFTPFLNLLGVVKLGAIKARDRVVDYAKKHGEEDLLAYVSWNDKLRLDQRTDCINLSVQRINAPLFNVFKRNYAQGSPWCILEIDPVCLEQQDAMFTVANAAVSYVRRTGTAPGLDGLKALFRDEIIIPKSYGVECCRRTESLPKNYTTSIQAEVLFPGEIPLSLVKGLVFRTNEDAARAKAMLKVEAPGVALPVINVCPRDFE